jgi:hypothetical protein
VTLPRRPLHLCDPHLDFLSYAAISLWTPQYRCERTRKHSTSIWGACLCKPRKHSPKVGHHLALTPLPLFILRSFVHISPCRWGSREVGVCEEDLVGAIDCSPSERHVCNLSCLLQKIGSRLCSHHTALATGRSYCMGPTRLLGCLAAFLPEEIDKISLGGSMKYWLHHEASSKWRA